MQTDSTRSGKGQYTKLDYDTVQNNKENLLAVSTYFEKGADILFQHKGFCGIRGRDADNKLFEIPCRYSYDNRGFEVDYVVAKSKVTAMKIGKLLEKEKQADNAINAHLGRAMTLDDNQLAAAMAITRGNVSLREGQSYYDANLGHWTEQDDVLKKEVSNACSITQDVTNQICWSFDTAVEQTSDNDALICVECDEADETDEHRAQLIDEYFNISGF